MEAVVRTLAPTYLLEVDWARGDLAWGLQDFHFMLRAAIRDERERDPEGMRRSNQAGCWHSSLTMFKENMGDPAVKQLIKMFNEAFEKYLNLHVRKGGSYDIGLSPWAMVMGENSWSAPHTHPNCQFSGVYYMDDVPEVTDPKADRHGYITFLDTRGTAGHQIEGLALSTESTVRPTAGKMVIFPQWIPHYVHPVSGMDERISVACNATIKPKKP